MREFERKPQASIHPAPAPEITPARDVSRLAGPAPAAPAGSTSAGIGRSPGLDTGALLHLQRTAGNQGVLQMLADDEERSPVHGVVGSGGGSPLDASTRSTMESAFGASFGDVRVHTDDRASQSAEAVGANAYTVGSDVVFKTGRYDPGSGAGQKTLAHELSHVVQQSRGPVDGTSAPGGIRVSDPSDRFEREADATAEQVVSAVQRQEEEEEEVQMLPAVQRQEDDEEEVQMLPIQRVRREEEEEHLLL
jgi:hypothetical protein